MAEFAALPVFTDAWIADTAHLNRWERGLYMDLLMLIWRSPECRVPNDQEWIARRLRCADDERSALASIIAEFCNSTGNWITQKRLSKEFEYVRESRRKQSERAKSRWNKDIPVSRGNAAPHDSGNAPTPSPTPSIEVSETSSDTCPKRQRVRTDYTPDFNEFWSGYPTDANMSKKEAFDVWKRLTAEKRQMAVASLPAFRAHCSANTDYRPIHACRYLSKERFEGHVATAREMASRRFIEQGSPQWDAWQRHWVATRGKGTPTTHTVLNGKSVVGWMFEAEWPPATVAATETQH